jgi:hypothetical protein
LHETFGVIVEGRPVRLDHEPTWLLHVLQQPAADEAMCPPKQRLSGGEDSRELVSTPRRDFHRRKLNDHVSPFGGSCSGQ